MKNKILVTGVAGFVGSHLVDRLLAKGYQVGGVDNFYHGDYFYLVNETPVQGRAGRFFLGQKQPQ